MDGRRRRSWRRWRRPASGGSGLAAGGTERQQRAAQYQPQRLTWTVLLASTARPLLFFIAIARFRAPPRSGWLRASVSSFRRVLVRLFVPRHLRSLFCSGDVRAPALFGASAHASCFFLRGMMKQMVTCAGCAPCAGCSSNIKQKKKKNMALKTNRLEKLIS